MQCDVKRDHKMREPVNTAITMLMLVTKRKYYHYVVSVTASAKASLVHFNDAPVYDGLIFSNPVSHL